MTHTQPAPENQDKKFRLGRLFMTPSAMEELVQSDVFKAFERHQAMDWGDVSNAIKAANDESLKATFRLRSKYRDRNGKEFWVITEIENIETRVFLPSEADGEKVE